MATTSATLPPGSRRLPPSAATMTRRPPSAATMTRRATHNVSNVHTHWYVHTYDCCKHHTRRGLHKHTHLDVLYDKLHQHYMLLRIRRHISLCSPILHVTAHQKAINIFSAYASQANTISNSIQVLYIGEEHVATTIATLPPGSRPPRPPWRGAARSPPEPRPAPLGAVRSRGSTYPIALVIFLKVKGALEVAENGLRCEIDLNAQLGFNRT